VEFLFLPVKRDFLFFSLVIVCLTVVGSFYGVTRALRHQDQPPLPVVNFYDKSDKKVTLQDFKGKVVLVNIWATWCLPCQAELPALDHLQKLLPQEKFTVVAISLDTSSLKTVSGFLQKAHIQNLTVYWDKDREVPLKWKYAGLPTSFLLNRDGEVIAQYDGPYVWDKEPVLGKIKDLVAK